MIFLPNLPPTDRSGSAQWRQLDYIGAFLSVAMVTLLLLPLQWGGNTRPWNDPVVISLLVVVSPLACVCIHCLTELHTSRESFSFWSLSRGSTGKGRVRSSPSR